jgi:exopolysaccharide biosynthesis polyprenyl glycosylphosphotransferase
VESSTATHRSDVARRTNQEPATEHLSLASQRGSILAKRLALGDGFAACVASAIVMLLLGSSVGWETIYFIAAAVALWPIAAFSVGLDRGDQLASWASGVPEVPRAFVALLLITWPLFAVAKAISIENPVIHTFLTVFGIAVCAMLARTAVRASLHRVEALQQKALILGSGLVAGQVVEKLGANVHFGVNPIGIVDDHVHMPGSPDLPWLGSFADLEAIIDEQKPERVVIAFSRASHERLLECVRICRDARVAVDVIPRLFEFLDGVRALDQVGGLPVLSIGTPTMAPSSIKAKRVLDVIGSSALIVLLMPLMLAIAIMIKLDSRGTIFFRQPRAGRDGTGFNLIKFRTMFSDAEERKAELGEMNEAGDGVMFKIREDPRITRIGGFLRRYSLDELPQLFNVLIGQMSLVGPRPLIFPETSALEKRWHLRRLELRPGLTGPWQVYGRSQNPFQEMIRFDYQYVAGWSLARDIEILVATVPAVLSGRGAY